MLTLFTSIRFPFWWGDHNFDRTHVVTYALNSKPLKTASYYSKCVFTKLDNALGSSLHSTNIDKDIPHKTFNMTT